jgi:type III pantothenate kinase
MQEVNAKMPDECFGPEFGFAYPQPSELGADRIAAAIAVQAWDFHPAVIVTCGTATAFTVVDAKGRLCGGAIAPGLRAQLDALVRATAQLPHPTLRMPRNALAKSTRDAIRAGVMLSFQGGVREITNRLLASLPSGAKSRANPALRKVKPRIVITGGNAQLAAQAFDDAVTVRPLLIFEGLLIIASRLWIMA